MFVMDLRIYLLRRSPNSKIYTRLLCNVHVPRRAWGEVSIRAKAKNTIFFRLIQWWPQKLQSGMTSVIIMS